MITQEESLKFMAPHARRLAEVLWGHGFISDEYDFEFRKYGDCERTWAVCVLENQELCLRNHVPDRKNPSRLDQVMMKHGLRVAYVFYGGGHYPSSVGPDGQLLESLVVYRVNETGQLKLCTDKMLMHVYEEEK